MINSYEFFKENSKYYTAILETHKLNNNFVFIDPVFEPKYDERLKHLQKNKDLITWKRFDEIYKAPIFDQELISPEYIAQGYLGDCYFISALTRVAKQPNLVQCLFERNLPNSILGEVSNSINLKCGAVIIYFQAFGRNTPVLIDTLIPTFNGKPIFSHLLDDNLDKSGWFCLVEKAFAKLNGSYEYIQSGLYSDSIYSLFGYYTKRLHIQPNTAYCYTENDLIVKRKNHIDKILKLEKYGCVMDSSINLYFFKNIFNEENIKKLGLYVSHSYTLLKTTKIGQSIFFLLRNPHGVFVWNGNYSENSSCWTPELKSKLRYNPKNGEFWMIDSDFFKYFTTLTVSKPFKPYWHAKYFKHTITPPTKEIPAILEQMKLEDYPNFVFQLAQPIPEGRKAKFRILIERRYSEFVSVYDRIPYYFTLARSDKKKLSSDVLCTNSFCHTFECTETAFSFCLEVFDINDTLTFVIHPKLKTELTINLYVRVFCELDFQLYDLNDQIHEFPKCDIPIVVLDNFTPSNPFKNEPLKRQIINGEEVTFFGELSWQDLEPDRNEENSKIIQKKEEKRNSLHYSQLGPQLNLDFFLFGKNIKTGHNLTMLIASEIETKRKVVVLKSRIKLKDIQKYFTEEISIRQRLNHSSIAHFIGYNDSDKDGKSFPLIFTSYYPNGSLSEALQNKKLNNTQKTIILIRIAIAMRFIHQNNIIHNNLKCSGIFLDENYLPKIDCFSKARYSESAQRELLSESVKNGCCLAPELLRGCDCSFPVDVFAFGVVFYHVISNVDPLAVTEKPSLECIPKKFHQFLQSLWEINPESRPTFNQITEYLIKKDNWIDDVDEENVKRYID